MIFKPIIPVIVMIIICIVLILLIIKTSKKESRIIRLLIVGILFIINLRIMIPNGEVEYETTNIDMVFVIDTTVSMKAEDYNGNNTRLSGVKKDIQYIIKKVPGAHYAIITYEGENENIKVPYTSDTNAINAAINSLRPPYESNQKGGIPSNFRTSLGELLETSDKKGDRVRVVFVFTDGEPNNEENLEKQDIKDLANYINGGAVLGYGTKTGGKMKNKYKYEEKEEYLTDREKNYGEYAISKIDEDNLKNIAKDLGIEYVHMEKSSNIDKVLNSVNKIKGLGETEVEIYYKDTYYYISPFIIILLLIELFLVRRSES